VKCDTSYHQLFALTNLLDSFTQHQAAAFSRAL
jgi:hypothetical protein